MLLGLGDAGGRNRHMPKSQGLNNHKSSFLTHVKSRGSAGLSAFQGLGFRFSSPCAANISTRDVKFMLSGEEMDGEGIQTVKDIGPEVPYHFCSLSFPSARTQSHNSNLTEKTLENVEEHRDIQ